MYVIWVSLVLSVFGSVFLGNKHVYVITSDLGEFSI